MIQDLGRFSLIEQFVWYIFKRELRDKSNGLNGKEKQSPLE